MKRLIFLFAVALIACASVAQTKMDLAQKAFDNGDYTSVIQYITDHLKASSKDVKALVLRTMAFCAQEEYQAAMNDVNSALKCWNKKCGYPIGGLYCLRALIYERTDNLPAATADYNMAVKKDDKNPESYFERGDFLYRQKQYKIAEADFRMAYKLDNTKSEYAIEVARCLIIQNKTDEANTILDNVIKYEPRNAQALQLRAFGYYYSNDYKSFIDLYISYLTYEHGDLDYLMYAASKEYGYALKMVSTQVKKTQDDEHFYWLGVRARIYQIKNQFEEALSDLRTMYKMLPDTVTNTFVSYQSALCYEGLYDYSTAADMYTILIDKAHGMGLSTYLYQMARGCCYERIGKYEEAISDYTEIIHENSDYTALAYCRRGTSKHYAGAQVDAVIEDYNKGLLFDENDYSCLIMRGKMYLTEKHDTTLANQDFEHVLRVDTTVVSDYTCRHYALMYLGRNEEAIDWLNKLLDYDSSAGNYYDAACLYARMNRYDEAMSCLKTAFEKGYRNFYHISIDDDLDLLRNRQDFNDLIQQYQKEKMRNLFNKL